MCLGLSDAERQQAASSTGLGPPDILFVPPIESAVTIFA